MIAELSRSKGVEAADPAEESALLGQLFIDESGEWSQHYKPSLLDQVHFVVINNIVKSHRLNYTNHSQSDNHSLEIDPKNQSSAKKILVSESIRSPIIEIRVPKRLRSNSQTLALQLTQNHLHS